MKWIHLLFLSLLLIVSACGKIEYEVQRRGLEVDLAEVNTSVTPPAAFR